MKRHKDYYEYKHVSFDFYNRVKNKHEFKKEWVSVRCPEDILQLKPSTVEVRRLKKNVWHNNNNCDNLYNCRANGWLLLKWEGLRMSNIITETYADKLYEELYEKYYKEVGKTTDDVGYIEREAERLALIDLNNFEMEG